MKQAEDCKIYVFHYKIGEKFPDMEDYIHILAGKENLNGESDLIGDDTGDNISNKNKYYSELSGLYWIYKNKSNDIIGTCHYRRFFSLKASNLLSFKIKTVLFNLTRINLGRIGRIYTTNKSYWGKYILTSNEAKLLLKTYDIILPMRKKLRQTLKEQYAKYHDVRDLKLLYEIIDEKTPEYIDSFESTLRQKKLYTNNMLIMRRELLVELCDWLFMILFEFEKRVDLNNYKEYQERIFGFLSERLITVWIHHKNLNIKELPLIYLKYLKKDIDPDHTNY